MQFIIIAHDGTDGEALSRRMAAREQHLGFCQQAVKRGEHLVGAAMVGDGGNMCGSLMVVEYPSRKELDEWLENEIYIKNGVWQEVEVIPCRVAPGFEHVLAGKESGEEKKKVAG